jgi:hypothetical protein
VGSSQFITVEVTDFSGIARVAVAYTWDDGWWYTADLTRTLDDPNIWTGSVPYTDTLSYFVQAVDGASNVGVETNKAWYFGLDSYPPLTTVTFDSAASGTNGWYRAPVTLTLSAIDGQSGVDYTAYRVNGGVWQTYTAPIVVTMQGTTTVNYYSVDVAGNTETVQTAAIRIDWTSPESVASVPASVSSSPITVTWVATDIWSGIESIALWYKFEVDGTWTDAGLAPQSGNSGTFYFVPNDDGTYCFATQATDWAGNAEPEPEPTGAGDACCEYRGRPVDYYVHLPLVLKNR